MSNAFEDHASPAEFGYLGVQRDRGRGGGTRPNARPGSVEPRGVALKSLSH